MSKGGTKSLLAMMLALYGLALANIFLRSSMGVLAPELSAELELSPRMLGLIASAFFLSYAVAQIPTGLMLDRLPVSNCAPARASKPMPATPGVILR